MLKHEEIKDNLPEYMRLHPEEVRAHIAGCPECREHFEMLSALLETEVPEPGEMFFETLPRRVRLSLVESRQRRGLLPRLLPAFAASLVAVVAVFFYLMRSPDEAVYPEWPSVSIAEDLNALSGADLAYIDDSLLTELYDSIREDSGGEIGRDDVYMLSSVTYQNEIVSLDREEMKGLIEALNEELKGGSTI